MNDIAYITVGERLTLIWTAQETLVIRGTVVKALHYEHFVSDSVFLFYEWAIKSFGFGMRCSTASIRPKVLWTSSTFEPLTGFWINVTDTSRAKHCNSFWIKILAVIMLVMVIVDREYIYTLNIFNDFAWF